MTPPALARSGRPPRRIIVVGLVLLLVVAGIWLRWTPGLEVRDGRHDRGSDAQHEPA
ncbi:MAG: hypothetical protein ACKV19_23545 [Verrucomicrobiales bacterium]